MLILWFKLKLIHKLFMPSYKSAKVRHGVKFQNEMLSHNVIQRREGEYTLRTKSHWLRCTFYLTTFPSTKWRNSVRREFKWLKYGVF